MTDMSGTGNPQRHTAAIPREGTLGDLRELTFDLPDDTPFQVSIRKAHDPDHFYEPVLVEDCLSVDMTGKPIVCFDAPEPRDLGV